MNRTLASLSLAAALSGVAAADELRPLKLEVVDQVIEQSDRAVQACGTRARVHDTLAVIMRLEIDGSGRVLSAEPSGKASAETTCLARVAKRLKFPATGLPSHVEYPFLLTPQLRR